jgi:hypothetical protein
MDDCSNAAGGVIKPLFCDLRFEALCGDEYNKKIIADFSKPKPAVPAKDWREKADEDEYEFCLQENGL